MTWKKRLQSVSGRVLLLLGSVTVGLLMLEGGLRLVAPEIRDHAFPRHLVQLDDTLGWRLAAGNRDIHTSANFEQEYVINSLGFRDIERSTSRMADSPARLLVFGDSQIFGWGIPLGQRLTDVAQAETGVELWNLGVPGYGFDQQLLAYQRDTGEIDVDGVIFYVSQATEYRLSFDFLFGISKPIFVHRAGQPPELVPPQKEIGQSFVYSMPRWMYSPYLLDRLIKRWSQREQLAVEQTESDPGVLLPELLDLALAEALARDHRLIVLGLHTTVGNERIGEICRDAGIPFLALDLPQGSELHWSDADPHWNVTAHGLLGKKLAEGLETALDPIS